MTLLRVVARPMLASMFVYGGVNALRHTRAMEPQAQQAATIAARLKDRLAPAAPVPTDPATIVRANALVHIGAGAALATGRMPRLAAVVLAASLAPTTLTSHRFWQETDPAARTNQRVHFLKNVSIAGGLLLSALDPDPHKRSWLGRARDWRAGRGTTTQGAGS